MGFLKNFWRLLKIAIPSWKNSVVTDLGLLTIFLAVRTFLSIYIAKVNGSVVKWIVKYDLNNFIAEIFKLGGLAFPASFVNSYLEFLTKKIALKFRRNMTRYFHNNYIKDLIFYQVGLHLTLQAHQHRL